MLKEVSCISKGDMMGEVRCARLGRGTHNNGSSMMLVGLVEGCRGCRDRGDFEGEMTEPDSTPLPLFLP